MTSPFPELTPNWIAGTNRPADSGETLPKHNPATGELLGQVARSRESDVAAAVAAAQAAQPAWAALPPVRRGEILHDVCMAWRARREELSRLVALETGKSFKAALGETDGGIACGLFYAGEGQRLYARTLTSGVPNKYSSTVRQPVGVAGLIIAANTPIPNVAWKIFPALICGNGVVLKAAEDTPASAHLCARLAAEAGLPLGLFNVVQGYGAEAGMPLVRHPEVGVLSFTGSTVVGKQIAAAAGERLAKVSLELGGKNALVICDDAELDNAVKWTLLSAFSNAGQRCAAASRIIITEGVYAEVRDRLIQGTERLRVGPGDEDDLGPVINERQLQRMLAAVERAAAAGARALIGGRRLDGPDHCGGYFLAPTLLDGARPADEISNCELFGPIACLYPVPDFAAALALANDSPYGLTACIHTGSVNRAVEFTQRVRAGVAVVNAGTYGSEPHMPFGGVGQSGNGTREPGTEALDIYSDLKNIIFNSDPAQV